MEQPGARTAQSVFTSKTWIANVVLASAMELVPAVNTFARSHPETMVLISTVMNLLLRHYTEVPITYRKPVAP